MQNALGEKRELLHQLYMKVAQTLIKDMEINCILHTMTLSRAVLKTLCSHGSIINEWGITLLNIIRSVVECTLHLTQYIRYEPFQGKFLQAV